MASPRDKSGNPEPKPLQDKSGLRTLDPILWDKHLSRFNELIMIGRLTPEVVHDINNYLTGILGYAELLSMKKIEDDSIRNGLKNIYLSADKCKDLLSNLIALSRPESSMTRLEDLNEVIEKTIILRNCALRHRQITVIKELGDNIPAVPLQGNKLEKTLLSLVFYAEEALEEREKDKKLVFKTLFQSPEEVIILITFQSSEKIFTVLSSLLESEATVGSKDFPLTFELNEIKQWLRELGASLELKKEGEEGLTLLIRLPLKG
jgi:signal transduction histidine kinase